MGGNASTNDRYINTMSRNVGDVLTMQLANASTVNTSGSKFELKSGSRTLEIIQWEDGYTFVDAYSPGRAVIRNAGAGGGISVCTSSGTSFRVYAGGVAIAERALEVHSNLTTETFGGRIRQTDTLTVVNTTLDEANDIVFLDASSNAVTADLPAAASHTGRVYEIICVDDTNACVVDANGSETISGDLTITLIQYEAITIVSDGTNWQVM